MAFLSQPQLEPEVEPGFFIDQSLDVDFPGRSCTLQLKESLKVVKAQALGLDSSQKWDKQVFHFRRENLGSTSRCPPHEAICPRLLYFSEELGSGLSLQPLSQSPFHSHFASLSIASSTSHLPVKTPSSLPFSFETTLAQHVRKEHFLEYCLSLFVQIVKCPATLLQDQITPALGKKENLILNSITQLRSTTDRKGSKRGNEKELSHNRSIQSNEFNFPNSQFPLSVPNMFLLMQFSHNFKVALQCID